MTDDKKVRKLVEAITLVKLAKKLNKEALEALLEAFEGKGDWTDFSETARQRMVTFRNSHQADEAMESICNAIQLAIDAEDAMQSTNRQAWEDAAKLIRKPPFAEDCCNDPPQQ